MEQSHHRCSRQTCERIAACSLVVLPVLLSSLQIQLALAFFANALPDINPFSSLRYHVYFLWIFCFHDRRFYLFTPVDNEKLHSTDNLTSSSNSLYPKMSKDNIEPVGYAFCLFWSLRLQLTCNLYKSAQFMPELEPSRLFRDPVFSSAAGKNAKCIFIVSTEKLPFSNLIFAVSYQRHLRTVSS